MTNLNIKAMAMLASALVIAGCASGPQLLPDSGPTSKDIIQGHYSAQNESQYQVTGNRYRQYEVVERDLVNHPSMSATTSDHIAEINADIKEVPNPQIVGYVYPHFNEGGMPVPGYFTVFRLYKQNHYALDAEGYSL